MKEQPGDNTKKKKKKKKVFSDRNEKDPEDEPQKKAKIFSKCNEPRVKKKMKSSPSAPVSFAERWKIKFQAVKEWYDANGRLPYRSEDRKLDWWIVDQRRKLDGKGKCRSPTPEERELLASIGIKASAEERFDLFHAELQAELQRDLFYDDPAFA
ncbi:hypothetical protein CTAYLR_002294 [Chrysophaeum taylorii]|uniref:Helicase-associated domain-containing protein n=1 Tax=Chrysophaeum taylorii TaxID=2483200 RepID=A0AAD7XN56_9STRA|nr:hypothetical protein CTAYLR_002294 [Chrysophaeum taylorii]